MGVSIVIPTYKRHESLTRLLETVRKQTLKPEEVIIVDSSGEGREEIYYSELKIRTIPSSPSVCLQRNIGIKACSSDLIMLCDDDIELPSDYLFRTCQFLENNPQEGVVTGLWREPNSKGEWVTSYPPQSIWDLLYNWLFGLSVWGSVDQMETSLIVRPIYSKLSKFYESKGNTLTKAGWPLVTRYEDNPQKVTVTSLGSALIRKSWIEGITFDESLESNGYGDNYGVCVQLISKGMVNVLLDCIVNHHHIKVNRMSDSFASYHRTLALGYFIKKYKTGSYRLFLWSVFGLILRNIIGANWTNAKIYISVMYYSVKRI